MTLTEKDCLIRSEKYSLQLAPKGRLYFFICHKSRGICVCEEVGVQKSRKMLNKNSFGFEKEGRPVVHYLRF